MRLMHATILITGGSSGIGLELARQLLARDNTVIIVGRRPESLEAAQARLPDLHIAVCDVSRPAAVAELFDELAPAFPALNVLVNCAGGMQRLDLLADRGSPELTAEIDVNLKGAMWMVARFLPLLKTQPQAAIVNVTSGLAYVPLAAAPIHSASKAGFHAYTRALRAQLAESAVQVFEIAPPPTDTPLRDRFPIGRGRVLSAEAVARAAIAGIERGVWEAAVGRAGLLRLWSRIAPQLAFARLNDAAGARKAAARIGGRRAGRRPPSVPPRPGGVDRQSPPPSGGLGVAAT
ncbi:SDR family NAD(P)-dependent oxidoreductase [Brevundimonas sp. M20]|nr:SDR family NAD(P)-dependent oxidoreductase [Brevundimonas sp. M20]